MNQRDILRLIISKRFRSEFSIHDIYALPLGWTDGTCRKRLCDLRDEGFVEFQDNAGNYKKL